MRKLFIITSIVFLVISIAFTILPLGTIAFLPVGIATILSFLAILKSDINKKKLPKWILFLALVNIAIIAGKEVFIKDEVVVDQQFIEKKEESKKEAIQDLEGLQ